MDPNLFLGPSDIWGDPTLDIYNFIFVLFYILVLRSKWILLTARRGNGLFKLLSELPIMCVFCLSNIESIIWQTCLKVCPNFLVIRRTSSSSIFILTKTSEKEKGFYWQLSHYLVEMRSTVLLLAPWFWNGVDGRHQAQTVKDAASSHKGELIEQV